MHYTSAAALLSLSAPLVAAVPFIPPSSYGWPTPNAQQVGLIQNAAGGTLSNAPPPPNPGPDGIKNLQLIAFNELFEVEFFSSLLENITIKAPGFELKGYDSDYIIDAFTAIVAQEELHALNANGALSKFGVKPVQPCRYTFPSTDFQSAIALAATFTDGVLGVLQDVQQIFADDKASGLVRAVGSVIGNEGEQSGFFRTLQGKRPSSAPFLTTNVRNLAFSSLIQTFVVPGSCPNTEAYELNTFEPLRITSKPEPKNSTLSFEVDNNDLIDVNSSYFITYISGANEPLSVPVKNVINNHVVYQFQADFPFESGFSDGLTIAALTRHGNFQSPDALDTVAGPALIELN